ncbi:MAG: hypothetical protein LW839_05650 [Cryomorphaceae bacterium]|jgi:predicted nucleic acid-binding Zn ribbon protein|nr:hypothetical protein [Cryomorphaceae bacterium]
MHRIQYNEPLKLRLVHMDSIVNKRYCKECGMPLKGRRDQKYCADQCRNQFNNRNYAKKLAPQRQINRILLQNQQILAKFYLIEKRRKILAPDLKAKGYHFDFHTHHKQAKNGQLYFFCYDFGYLRLSDNQLLLVHNAC